MTVSPLHTRMITLRLSWGEGGQMVAEGRLVDVRKRGIVPLAGRIQGPGIVHDMAVRVWLDPVELRIARIEPAMLAYPFAAAPQTRGEACPDQLAAVQGLLGLALTKGYGETVMERIGGPRGCFHVLTLLRLLGPTIVWAATRERLLAQSGEERPPAPGSPIFSRSVIVDGMRRADMLELDLHGTLCDVHYPPGADTLPLDEELEAGFEATLDLTVGLPAMAVLTASGRIRRSGPGVAAAGAWQPIDSLGQLGGLALQRGFSARVQELLGDAEGIEPLTHLVLMLAPVVMQCMPSLLDELELRPRHADTPHAATDSCHMWRAGGPLMSMRRLPA